MARTHRRAHYDSPRKCRFVGRVLADPSRNLTQAAIAEGIHPRTARDIWYKFVETGSTHRRPGSGRPSLLNPVKKRRIVIEAVKNRRAPFREIGNVVGVSASVVRDYLDFKNYHRCIAKRVVFLTPAQKKRRLQWAERNSDRNQWDNIIWSDECYVYLDGSRNSVFVTRRPDEKYEEDCVVPTFKQSSLRVMIWGCIMQNRKGPLVVLEYPGGKGGGMTAQRYISQVLEDVLLPFYTEVRAEMARDVLFQQDGAAAHRAKVTQEWLRAHEIASFSHPASSPDLSPIEPVWHTLKSRLRARPRLPTNLEELKRAVKEVWADLTLEDINRHVVQMPDRVTAVLVAEGGHTKY